MKDFGETARGLAKNPLGIIALFIVLIYGFASLVVTFSSNLTENERTPMIWFLVLFPIAVLGVFGWLVSKHHKKLYGPGDYKNEEHFLEAHEPDLAKLELASPDPVEEPKSLTETTLTAKPLDFSTPEGRARDRQEIYGQHRGFFLAHVLEPSSEEGQLFNIFIYLIRHKSADFSDLKKAEFFFGHYWGNKIYEGKRVGKFVGVRTSAYGPFLCTCRITFLDGTSIRLYRYIDFEMGHFLKDVRG